MRVFAVAASFAIAVSACAPANSNGADGGDANAATGTVGDQCTRIFSAFCLHAINDCAIVDTPSNCVANAQVTCCADKCGKPAITPDRFIEPCVSAVKIEGCNGVAQSLRPTACEGIPQLPQ